MRKNHPIIWPEKEELEVIIKGSTSRLEVLRKLGYTGSSSGNVRKKFLKYCDIYNIDTSHFVWGSTGRKKSASIESILDGTVPLKYSKRVRAQIIQSLEYKCEECGLENWQNKVINLQIHHKDRNRNNNRRDNIQLLCPNCHSQTDDYGFKGLKRYRELYTLDD